MHFYKMTDAEQAEWEASYFAEKMKEMHGDGGDVEMASAQPMADPQPQGTEPMVQDFVNTVTSLEGQSIIASKKARKTCSDKGKARGP